MKLRRGAALLAWPALLLALAGVVAGQEVAVSCSVQIRQPRAGAFTTNIDCQSDGDTSTFTVAVQNATAINNAVTYRLNGEVQRIGNTSTDTYVQDGYLLSADGLGSWYTFPALVAFAFLGENAPTAPSQTGTTLTITASIVNVVLPSVDGLLPGGGSSAFSGLRFAGIETLNIVDSTFDRISSAAASGQKYAAAVYYGDLLDGFANPILSPSITVTNTTFSNFAGGVDTGALTFDSLLLNSYGALSIRDTNFTRNAAASNGAGLYASIACAAVDPPLPCAQQLSLTNCRFTSNNSTAGSGGGLYLAGGPVVISRSIFTSNSAANSGGALFFTSSRTDAQLNISESVFSGNIAGTVCEAGCNVENDGGAAMAVLTSTFDGSAWAGSTVLDVRDSTFINNRNDLVNKAGAVLFGRDRTTGFTLLDTYLAGSDTQNSTGLFRNVTFTNNFIPRGETTGAGGAIYDFASQGLTVDNCTFLNNTAGTGSTIYSLWSTYLAITGGTIIQNSTSQRAFGGAVAMSDLQRSLTIQNAIFRDNVCRSPTTQPMSSGAALWLERQVVESPDLPYNYTASISNTQFINNRCQQAGAVYISQVEHTIGPNVLFDGNTANVLGSAGGALMLAGLTDPQYLAAAQSSTITRTIFRNNRANSNGGALFTDGIWQPRITGCSFLNNSVTSTAILSDVGNSGGAMYINTLQKAALVITSTNFTNNTAYQGGAVTIAQSNLSMTSCLFDGNVATGEGGAIRWNTAELGHQINVTSTNFTRNRAITAGALQVSQAGAIVSGCQFADNSASLDGGAISFESCAPAANTTLGRYTPAYGLTAGAVADSQTAYVLNSVFERNFALSRGGGAISATSSRVVLVRSRFSDNNSTASGGGLYGEQSIINDYFGTFDTNSARQGGAFYTESCNVTFNSTLIQGNSASRGGGVSVGLTRADLRYPGLVSVELNNCTATNNVAQSGIVLGSGYGGGLSSEGSNVTIRGGTWNSNTAAVGGGAIDARGNSTLVMQDVGNMRLNSARGGTGGAANFDGMLAALVINTNMQNNSALSDGGSLWSGSSYCVLLVSSNFSNSLSTTGSGGGAYFALPGVPGCSAAAISAYLPQLSPSGLAALPQALRPQGQPSGRRLLQQSVALDSIDLNLLVLGTTVTSGNAVNGGGLAVQSTPGSAAVLDRVTVSGCTNTPAGTCSITGRTSTTSSDGGGMYMTMIKPVLAVQTTSTCNVLNETSTIDITSSTLTSNAANFGGGGAAAVVSSDAALILQATFSNSTITNNTASNGGALSAEGPGAFLSVLSGTRVFANVAAPPDSAASGASGGCIYAHNCQGLLLGNSTELSSCQAMSGAGGRVTVNGVSATATGSSTGGAVMVDGCSAVVVDGASITGNTAGVGGGIAARDTTTLLLLNATLTGNTASVVNVTASPGTSLDALRGVGGGLWVTGDTASLVRGSDLSRNNAGLMGGAAAALTDCFNNATLAPIQVPAALADYSMLRPLAARSASGCYTMTVQNSYVTNNQAQGPGANPPGSGGAFFASSNTSIIMSTCADIQTPRSASTPVSRNPNLGEVRSNLLQLSSCPPNGNLAVGYGNIVATMPMTLALDPTKTSEQPDPSVNATDQSAVPLVWFTRNNELVLPSTSPLTPTLITLRVMDGAGQDVRDPYLSNLVTITATSADTATDSLDIYGTKMASYNGTTGDYRIDGMALKAVVGRSYMFEFTLTSTLGGVDAVPPLRQVVVVPDCSDGETYVDDQRQACRTCDGSFFAFSKNDTGLGMPAPACLPCPSEGQCSGGAVLVPADGQWHSSPNSTAMHNCMNSMACARDDNKTASLQSCQSAWYAFKRLVQIGMTQTQIDSIANAVLNNYNCTLYTVDTLVPLNPAGYLSLLCADGYGGNLCGVCVTNSNGKQTALRSNNQCSECSPEWVVYLVSAVLFVVNLLIILIQVFAALGEQMLSNTVQFADIFGAIIGHVQYLIVVLKLQFEWPSAVTEFHKVVSSTVSFADDAIKFASITCLSDGSPEAQATYQMGSSLVLPLILISAAAIIWIISYYLRLYLWYPRLDRRNKEQGSKSRGVQDSVPSEMAMGPDQIMMEIKEEEEEHGQDRPETPGRGVAFGRTSGPSGHQSQFRELGPSQRRSGPGIGPTSHASGRILTHSGYGPDAGTDFLQGGASLPARGWSDAIRSTTHRSVTDIPGADAEDDAPPPNANQMLSEPAPSLRRNQTDLRRWQLPGAEKPPEEALWFDTTAEEKERQQRKEEDRNKLSLIEKFRLLDKYMPLWQQLLAVFINSGFVVYQGWASAALSPFACQFLDDGQLDSSIPDDLAYYADFQRATAPNGYWNLNMNQACYEGYHLSKWTPIGAVMSFVIGLGIPFLMFLPVFLNRKELTGADVQLRWGWLYIRFYYGRLPYWMAMQALELLLFIIVQTFTGGLDSVIEQAVLLQLTLLVILVFNTCMWPLVHPLLILTSFLSNAILIFTLGLAIIIGDGSSWVLSEGAANTAGAFIVILNVFYVVLLLALFYKHARDVIQEGFLTTTTKTRKVVGRMWQRSLMATRGLRSMKTYTGVRSILGRSRKKTASGQSMEPGAESIEPGRNNSIEQARDAAVRAVEQEAAMDRALGEEYGHGSTGTPTAGPPRFLPVPS